MTFADVTRLVTERLSRETVLGGVACLCAVMLVLPNGAETGSGPARSPAGLIPDAPGVAPGALTQAPLFHVSRRPPAPVAEEPIAVPDPQNVVIQLSGIVGDTNDGYIAFFRASNRSELLMAEVGDRIDRWTVEEIERTRVLLRDDAGETTAIDLENG
ncbi:hypothetical protein AADZ90_001035 [Aestuariibius sp. 2305UL40-4]|uniref:hypothetical protein n=1 Tax=Aestuariibius violaceus TaxID=3234132 RepID=UPI00345E26EF